MSGPTCRKPTPFYCLSPIACGGWGYCRERNMKNGVPDEQMQAEWRKLDDPEAIESDAYGRTGEREECSTCGGSGLEYGETCLGCGGFGWTRAACETSMREAR